MGVRKPAVWKFTQEDSQQNNNKKKIPVCRDACRCMTGGTFSQCFCRFSFCLCRRSGIGTEVTRICTSDVTSPIILLPSAICVGCSIPTTHPPPTILLIFFVCLFYSAISVWKLLWDKPERPVSIDWIFVCVCWRVYSPRRTHTGRNQTVVSTG